MKRYVARCCVLACAIVTAGCTPSLITVKGERCTGAAPARVAEFVFQPLPAPPVMPLVAATNHGCPPQFAACFDGPNLALLLTGTAKQKHYIEVEVPRFYWSQIDNYKKEVTEQNK